MFVGSVNRFILLCSLLVIKVGMKLKLIILIVLQYLLFIYPCMSFIYLHLYSLIKNLNLLPTSKGPLLTSNQFSVDEIKFHPTFSQFRSCFTLV